VLRGGFSMAYVREGVNTFQSLYASNAASGAKLAGGTISATQNITNNPFPLSFGNYIRNGLPAGPNFQQEPVYPNTGSITDSINEFLPNLKIGRVDSFSFGIQRELNSNNVIEIRYVGNRGHNLWRQYDLNEVNVIENGFLNEFRLAQQNVLANLAELVVKEVHGAGGYGMLVGPAATRQELEEFRAAVMADPERYIAQPTLSLSTCPTFVESGIAPRHIDLRPFVLSGKTVQMVPGGLTRVALKEGSLVVNSSQGGGTKDTWVLEA
jgi:hypothetical protein